ncbi:MAG: BCCT family transporter [Bilophila wadsworthia]
MSNAALDKKILLPTIAIVLLTSAPLIFYASSLQGMIQSIYDFTAKSFGWGYILLYLLGGFFVFFIAFSPYGKIKLGGHDQKPVFNNFHWGSMIIAAGHGIGMVNWSMVEPLITNNAAPLGHGANAAYSYEVATAYTFFHWGPTGCCTIPCIPIFISWASVKNSVSECLPSFGRRLIGGWFGVCLTYSSSWASPRHRIDAATAVQLVSGLYADYFGLPDTQALHLGVLGMFTVITLGSIRKPLSKGMRLLSDMNSILALSLLAIVLIGGATGYFFSLGTNTLGMVLDMFPRVSGWTDPFNASGFPAKWTVFYGAWFLAYGPMMAIFFTGISMGRTLRETVLGVYFFGCLSSFLFSVIFGGFSLYLQYTGQFDVYAFYLANGLPNTVSKVVSLTAPQIMSWPSSSAAIFLTTTIDAATRVMASMSSRKSSDQEPSVTSKYIWCISLSILVLGVLLVGGLEIIKHWSFWPPSPSSAFALS